MKRIIREENDGNPKIDEQSIYSGYGLNVKGDQAFVACVSNSNCSLGFDSRGGSGIMTLAISNGKLDKHEM